MPYIVLVTHFPFPHPRHAVLKNRPHHTTVMELNFLRLMAGLDGLSGLFQPLFHAKVHYTTRETQNNTQKFSPQKSVF